MPANRRHPPVRPARADPRVGFRGSGLKWASAARPRSRLPAGTAGQPGSKLSLDEVAVPRHLDQRQLANAAVLFVENVAITIAASNWRRVKVAQRGNRVYQLR